MIKFELAFLFLLTLDLPANPQDSHHDLSTDRRLFRPIVPISNQPNHQTIGWRNQIAMKNIFSVPKYISNEPNSRLRRSTSPRDLHPGDPAPAFTANTLDGVLRYPGGKLKGHPIIIHTYDRRSGFLESLWNNPPALDGLLKGPNNAEYVFISTSQAAYTDTQWMKKRIVKRMKELKLTQPEIAAILGRLHFVTVPLYELGNWIPDLLKEWRCEEHNCGYYQAVFQVETTVLPLHLNMRDCLLYDPNCAAKCK